MLGGEEMNDTVSVFGSFDPKRCMRLCEDACIICGERLHVFFLHLWLRFSSVTTEWCLSHFSPVYSVSVAFRYPPSSRQTSHEEGKEWLRSHSTGGLQDTGSQSPLSPPGASCTTTGKYHYSNLCRFTEQACQNKI